MAHDCYVQGRILAINHNNSLKLSYHRPLNLQSVAWVSHQEKSAFADIGIPCLSAQGTPSYNPRLCLTQTFFFLEFSSKLHDSRVKEDSIFHITIEKSGSISETGSMHLCLSQPVRIDILAPSFTNFVTLDKVFSLPGFHYHAQPWSHYL